jgi:hypothetical protein
MKSVYSAVRTGYLNEAVCGRSFKSLNNYLPYKYTDHIVLVTLQITHVASFVAAYDTNTLCIG